MEIDKKSKLQTVLFLTKWYPNKNDPQLGVFVQKHAKAVAQQNWNVILLYVYSDSLLTSNYEINQLTKNGFLEIIVCYKKNNSSFQLLINFYRYIHSYAIGFNVIKERTAHINLIHVNILNRPGIIALLLSKIKNIPYIVSEHWGGYITGEFEKSNFIKKWITKLIISNAKAVTVVSSVLKNKMQELGLKNKYALISNVIEQVDIADENIITNAKIKILTIADLVDDVKNISGIIKAIAAISMKNKDFEYHIIGDGADKDSLIKLADSLNLTNRFIFFHGRQANDYVYHFLKKVNFIIINSNSETFSIVAAEALVSGKPVITTTCGGPEEFITAEHGILISPNDSVQLQTAIENMILNFKKYNPKKLSTYAVEKFSYEKIGTQFIDLYDKVK
jgi:glycosyltransferase involved in cell wall biosynthesis